MSECDCDGRAQEDADWYDQLYHETLDLLRKEVSDDEVALAKQAFVRADPYFSPSGKSVRAMLEAFVLARSSVANP